MVQVPSTGGSERLPAATGVVAARLAASCCLLPLALIAPRVGRGGATRARGIPIADLSFLERVPDNRMDRLDRPERWGWFARFSRFGP